MRNAKPTVLIGVTARRGLFSREILDLMAQHDERPVILPLSNPTSKCECTPEEVAEATGGRGLMATGSPFAPVDFGGRRIVASQCNNTFVFPGVGLGALVARAPKVTDGMFLAASRALCGAVTERQRLEGHLLPEMADIRTVSRVIATSVAIEAREEGIGRLLEDDELERLVTRAQWEPRYSAYRPRRV